MGLNPDRRLLSFPSQRCGVGRDKRPREQVFNADVVETFQELAKVVVQISGIHRRIGGQFRDGQVVPTVRVNATMSCANWINPACGL